MSKTLAALALITLFSVSAAAPAFEPLRGEFVAQEACPARTSTKKATNPGRVRLEADKHYAVSGRNKPNGRYLQLRVPGARPELRWVEADCGQLLAGPSDSGTPKPEAGRYLLALSWQPAFCETKPTKTECRTQTADRFDAVHFSLHGLWPQPENNVFCGVSAADRQADKKGRWEGLPEPQMSEATRQRLAVAMPGTASQLQRHEYTKHGSCFPGSADDYFRTSLNLLDEFNASQLQQVMAANLGKSVSAGDLRQAFERSFGPGSGKALEIHCIGDIDSRRTLIYELRVALQGSLSEGSRLRDVLDTTAQGSDDCHEGIVDVAGDN